jgi:3-phosphoshikimate 1-carboxyvinyltransferase
MRGGKLSGIAFENAHASAQVKSAILLAGLRSRRHHEVTEPRQSRDHTERMLPRFGCPVEMGNNTVRLVGPARLTAAHIEVPADPSSAAFPLVAALLVPGSEISLRSILANPLRTGLFTTLQEMGAALSFSEPRAMSGRRWSTSPPARRLFAASRCRQAAPRR